MTMKSLRLPILLALTVALLLALSVSPALAATEGYNAPAAATQAGATVAAPVYVAGPWTCWGFTAPTSVKLAHLYDFSTDLNGSAPTTFPDGTFSGITAVREIENGWATWNPQIPGKHVATVYGAGIVTITFGKQCMSAVGVVAEPNAWAVQNVKILAFDMSGALIGGFTRAIDGDHGAAFIGLWSTMANIKSVVITCNNGASFAFSDLYYGNRPWGDPNKGHTRY